MSCLVAGMLAAVVGLGPAIGCGGLDDAPPSLLDHRTSVTPEVGPAPVVEQPERTPVVERPERTPVVEQPERTPVVEQPEPLGEGVVETSRPLAGRVVVLDAGHQLGNRNFPSKINRPVPAGGFTKPCNTTGTATDAGYPEATFAWRVTVRLQARLERAGATVHLTRTSNRADRWGPCVDVRGRAGNARPADLKLSIHGDGSYAAGAHGFHVIFPPDRAPWTDDIHGTSLRLAKSARDALVGGGFSTATYVGSGGLDERGDLATLNLSDVPTVVLELGNMRDRRDARTMTSARGQARYARALDKAVRSYLSE